MFSLNILICGKQGTTIRRPARPHIFQNSSSTRHIYPVQSNETYRQFSFLNLLSRANIIWHSIRLFNGARSSLKQSIGFNRFYPIMRFEVIQQWCPQNRWKPRSFRKFPWHTIVSAPLNDLRLPATRRHCQSFTICSAALILYTQPLFCYILSSKKQVFIPDNMASQHRGWLHIFWRKYQKEVNAVCM